MHRRSLPRPLSALPRSLRRAVPVVVGLLTFAVSAVAAAGEGRILLKLNSDPCPEREQQLLCELPAGSHLSQALPQAQRVPGMERILRLELPSAADVAPLVARLSRHPLVEWAECAPLRHTDLLPNDSRYSELWAPAAVSAPAAWDLATPGTHDVILADVDTGVELAHPDLAAALWTNTAEASGTTGVDDDGNGYVDDIHGYDLRADDDDPNPDPGDTSHGTHTAGTAACVTNNGAGVSCLAWNAAQLMAVRAGHGTLVSHGVEGLWYAALSGARIANCSWGGDSYSYYEHEVIRAVRELGLLVVAAAGNNGSSREHYPGAYPEVLCVASLDADNHKLSSSQYGGWVDLAAPGSSILSTVIGGSYGYKTGTSMAAPQVASLAALVLHQHPAYSVDQLREHITFTCNDLGSTNPSYAEDLGRGMINAQRALAESPCALVLAETSFDDANGDGIADPGEELEMQIRLNAVLGDFSSIQLSLSLPEGGGTVLDGTAQFTSVTQGNSVINSDALRLRLDEGLENGSRVKLRLLITANNGFSHRQFDWLVVSPVYVTHDNGQLQCSLSGQGSLGYHDFATNSQVGSGLIWPSGASEHLYHGSLMVACANGLVADNAEYLSGIGGDFVAGTPSITMQENGDTQTGNAGFDDSNMEIPLGLHVDQRSWTFSGTNEADLLLVEYTLLNTGSASISALRPGLWMDFDINGDWGDDTAGWISSAGCGWQTDASGAYLGICLLTDVVAGFRVCHWDEWQAGGLSDSEKLSYMSSGFSQTSCDTPDDLQLLLSAPAHDLAAGELRVVAFGILGANSTAGLEQGASVARSRYIALDAGDSAHIQPDLWNLSLYPNPCNPATMATLRLSRPGMVQWRLFDLRGACLECQTPGRLVPGVYQFPVDLSGRASGQYFVEFQLDHERVIRRVQLIK